VASGVAQLQEWLLPEGLAGSDFAPPAGLLPGTAPPRHAAEDNLRDAASCYWWARARARVRVRVRVRVS